MLHRHIDYAQTAGQDLRPRRAGPNVHGLRAALSWRATAHCTLQVRDASRYIQLCQMHSNQDTETSMPEGKAVADVRFSSEHWPVLFMELHSKAVAWQTSVQRHCLWSKWRCTCNVFFMWHAFTCEEDFIAQVMCNPITRAYSSGVKWLGYRTMFDLNTHNIALVKN